MAGVVTLSYDGTGRRVLKEASAADPVQFVWDFGKVLQEVDLTTGLAEQYLSTDKQFGDLLGSYGPAGSKYFGSDALGSTENLIDDSGAESDAFAYRAYGLQQQLSGTDAATEADRHKDIQETYPMAKGQEAKKGG